MPFLDVVLSDDVQSERIEGFRRGAVQFLADQLAKPVGAFLTRVETGADLHFADRGGPALFLTLKSIGLPEEGAEEIIRGLTDLAHRWFTVAPRDMYLEFSDVHPAHWGWDGASIQHHRQR